MTTAWIVSLVVVMTIAFGFLLSFPRWFTRSMHRHRLWKLRDDFVDDVLSGVLPRNHPAVGQMLNRLDRSVHDGIGNRALDLIVFQFARRTLSPSVQRYVRAQAALLPLDGLDGEQVEKMETYRATFQTLLAGMLMLGSWTGVVMVLVFVPRSVARVVRDHPGIPLSETAGHPKVRASMRVATDEAVDRTWLGRQYKRDVAETPWRLVESATA